MKLKGLKHFRWKDVVRERMVDRKPEEVFEGDVDKESDQIYLGLWNQQIVITDESYVPKKGRYVGVHTFVEYKSDGGLLKITPGEFVTLDQAEACRFLIGGFVKPESETAWTPQRLLTGDIGKAAAKKMFDDEPSKKNFATDYKVRGGTD